MEIRSTTVERYHSHRVNHCSTYPDLFRDSHWLTCHAKTCERILHHRAIHL